MEAEQVAREKNRKEEQKQKNSLQQEALNQYDGIVTDLLKLLLQSAFTESPKWEVRLDRNNLMWSIGHYEIRDNTNWEGDSHYYTVWVWGVEVVLVFDSNHNPHKFNVRRWNPKHGDQTPSIEAGLSQAGLIEVLQELYPKQSKSS